MKDFTKVCYFKDGSLKKYPTTLDIYGRFSDYISNVPRNLTLLCEVARKKNLLQLNLHQLRCEVLPHNVVPMHISDFA